MRAYSEDLRRRVIEAVKSGGGLRKIGKQFRVSKTTVSRWYQRYQETGEVKAKQMGSPGGLKLESERTYIMEQIKEEPHISLRELARNLTERGIKTSHRAVWTFVRRSGLSYKKKPVCR